MIKLPVTCAEKSLPAPTNVEASQKLATAVKSKVLVRIDQKYGLPEIMFKLRSRMPDQRFCRRLARQPVHHPKVMDHSVVADRRHGYARQRQFPAKGLPLIPQD